MKKQIFSIIVLLAFSSFSWAQQLAFPGAEGYGKYTKGGRGGVVYEVTNLNDVGTGSLRAAVEASGPRTVVFRVSGNIVLTKSLEISNSYITIAGQTAPGDGICISKYPLVVRTNDVIIRYIRVRLGDESGELEDAVSGRYRKNIIIDHVSASWSVDETMSLYHNDSLTIQWCIISESLYNSNHPKGAHGYGGIWGGNFSTHHHNLLAHHSSRNPRFSSGSMYTDYRNNVAYNWGFNSSYGGEAVEQGDPETYPFSTINMVANYYKPGPATTPGNISYRIVNPSSRDLANDYGDWYVSENYMFGNNTVTSDNWNGGVQPQDGSSYLSLIKLEEEFPGTMRIEQQTAENAFISVMDNAGATLPQRDSVDLRVINDTRTGTATYEGTTYESSHTVKDKTKICGIIDSQTDVGGWPQYNSTTAPSDSDHDGMPDDWEDAHSLDKNNASDRNTIAPDGYTMLEKYLNSIEFNNAVTGMIYRFTEQNNIKVTWKDTYIGEEAFIILKSTGEITFEPYDTVAKNITEYTDTFASGANVPFYCIVAMQGEFQTPCITEYIQVTNIEIQAPDTIHVDDTTTITVTIVPENANNQLLQWSLRPEDTILATISQTGELIAKDTGAIELTVKSLDSLSISDTISITIRKIITGKENYLMNTTMIFRVFPNPFDEKLNIEFIEPAHKDATISLYNMTGALVAKENTISEKLELNTSNLSPGMYLLVLHNNGKIYSQKINKK